MKKRVSTFETVKNMGRSIVTSSERINVEALRMHRSKPQEKATAWGSGDFKALISINAGKYRPVELRPANEPDAKPQRQAKPKHEPKKLERKPKPEHIPGAKHNVGYRQRKIELSDTGVRIDAMLRKNNTNIRRVSRLLGMKPDTFMNAMRPGSRCKKETFEAISKHFGVSLEWLMYGDKNETQYEQDGADK